MPLRKNFGSGRSLQSLFHFVPQRISAATLHAGSDFRFMIYRITKSTNNRINPKLIRIQLMICQSQFISDSIFIIISREISCRIRNCVRMSLRGTQQSHHYYFLVFVGTDYKSALSVAGHIRAVGLITFGRLAMWRIKEA